MAFERQEVVGARSPAVAEVQRTTAAMEAALARAGPPGCG